jgi:phosphoribosylformylglycinamidine synthase subunit PurS
LLINQEFNVIVTIENKPFINDPEGETIYRDLILKNNYENVKSVRTAKVLKLIISANNSKEAILNIRKMCDDLRIFNPLVSNCHVNVIHNKEEINKDV